MDPPPAKLEIPGEDTEKITSKDLLNPSDNSKRGKANKMQAARRDTVTTWNETHKQGSAQHLNVIPTGSVPKRVSYFEDLMALMPPISEKDNVEKPHRSCEDTPTVPKWTENRSHLISIRRPKTLKESEKIANESGDEDWVDIGDTNEEEDWVKVDRGNLSASCWWPSIGSTPAPRAGKLF